MLALEHNLLVYSALLIGIATLFDFLDGFVARLVKSSSELGKQLDSLADMVTFGLAPAIMAYVLMGQLSSSCCNSGLFSIKYIAFITPLLAALRLAKFNIDTRQSKVFYGLPSPANAIFLASFIALYYLQDKYPYFQQIFDIIYSVKGIAILTVISSFLMIADTPMIAMKFSNFSFKENKGRYLFLLGALIGLITLGLFSLPFIILFYVLVSFLTHYILKW